MGLFIWRAVFGVYVACTFGAGTQYARSKEVTVNCRVIAVSETKDGHPMTAKDCVAIKQKIWDPISFKNVMAKGACRWSVGGPEGQDSKCLCPADINTCTAKGRGACYWHVDSDTEATSCISNAERFYNHLARLLRHRGKKEFSIKLMYGAAPARGQLPQGIYGPAYIGMGANQFLPKAPTIASALSYSPYAKMAYHGHGDKAHGLYPNGGNVHAHGGNVHAHGQVGPHSHGQYGPGVGGPAPYGPGYSGPAPYGPSYSEPGYSGHAPYGPNVYPQQRSAYPQQGSFEGVDSATTETPVVTNL